MATPRKHVYEFGPFTLIPSERQLLRDHLPVSLAGKSFDLLVVLVENSGRLVGKEELLKRIWPDSFVEEANLSVNMTALRRALGEGRDDLRYVETVPRHGYRFVAEVREKWENGATIGTSVTETGSTEQVAESHPISSRAIPVPASRAPTLLRKWVLVAIAVVLIVSAIVGLNVGGLRERIFGSRTPIHVQSLAVLPLANISDDAAQDYFADGMTDALITSISKIQALRVISRPVVMNYKRAGKSPTEIGRELKVDAVITGSIVRNGDQVRLSLQLIHVPTGRNLLTEDYDRELRYALALQADVRRDVGDKLGLKIPPQPQQTILPSVNTQAYEQYLRGQFYLYRQTRENNEAAIAALEKAVAADPNFAAAHAELAQAYVWKLFLFAPDEKQLEEKAFIEVEKALALDPDSAVAYLARGRLLWTPANHFPHDRAIKEYRHALALNPALDEAHNQLAVIYAHIGAFPEALQESQLALSANPKNDLAQLRIAQTFNYQGKYEDALTVLRAIPENANPSLVGHQTAWALFNLGKKEQAAAKLKQLLKDYPEDTGGVFSSIQAALAASDGQDRVAENLIKSAIEKGKGFGHFHHTAHYIACAYALMNKPSQAVKWLEAAADDGFPCYPLFEVDTNLNNIRQDAGFVAFLSRSKQKWEYYKSVLQS